MIIQCRKCETRFRFSDHLMEGDGVWVRCSRCQHVFFQERTAGDPSAAEPEIPSVRISDARRTPGDRFPVADERPLPTGEKAEIAPQHIEDTVKILPVGFEKESVAVRMDADMGEESLDDQTAGLIRENMEMVRENLARLTTANEKEDMETEMAEEELPAGGTERRGWGRTLLKLIALMAFIVIVAGAVYLYLFPDVRTQILAGVSPWLRGVPVLENLVGKEMKSGGTALMPVRIKDVRQRSVANLLTGNLQVIEGVAVNQSAYPLARIRLRLVIADAYDVVLGEKIVFCGNLMTDEELGAMAEPEIQRELSIPQGSDVSNERIAPNGEIPFMIVFSQEQAGTVKTTVVPAGADRIP